MASTSELTTVAGAASRYLQQLSGAEQLQSQQEINRFVRWLGATRRFSTVSSHDVASFAESLGTTTTDVLRRLEPVKAFLNWTRKEGYTAHNLGSSLRPLRSPARAHSKKAAAQQGQTVSLTPEGFQHLQDELAGLKAERPRIAEALRHAMADKDFRENAPLDAARDHQAHVEARIRELERVLRRAEIMETVPAEISRVRLGSTVVLEDVQAGEELRFTLVHPNEVNVAQGKLSVASPIGKAVIDRSPGEEVEVFAPAGVHRYRIQAVEGTQ